MARISLFLFFLFSTYGLMTFFLSLYMRARGLDAGEIGTVMACGAFTMMIAQPFWGYVSDRLKTVKKVILALLVLGLLAAIGLLSAVTMPGILVMYMLFTFFNSATGPLAETLCISYSQQNKIDYGRVRLWGELGVGTSTLMLGFVMQSVGVDHLWLLYAGMLSVAFSASVFMRDTESTPVPVDLGTLRRMFTTPRMLWFLLLVLVIAIPHKMNDSMLGIYIKEIGGQESQLGLAWTIATFSAAASLLFIGRVIGARNEMIFFAIGAGFYVLRWFLYSVADSPSVLIAAQGLHAVSFVFMFVAAVRYLRRIVPPELQASGQAAFAVMFSGFGGIIGNAGGGFIVEHYGLPAVYGWGSLLALGGALAAFGTYVYNRKRGYNDVRPESATTTVKG